MPLLTTAVTVLGLAGTPAIPGGPYDHTQTPVLRTYSSPFTRLYASGPGRVYGSFAGKSSATADIKYGSDTITPVVTEGNFESIDIEVLEVMSPRVADSTSVGQAKVVSESIVPRVADVIQFLSKGGSVSKSVSDSVRVFVTDSSGYLVAVSVTDIVTAVVADTSSVQKDNALSVSDTITPVLSDVMFVQQSLSGRSFAVTDVVTPVLTERSIVRAAGEVDFIRIEADPFGYIRITEV